MTVTTELGAELAQAVATKDAARLRALLADDVDFRGLTPRRVWDAADADEVVDVFFGHWFEDTDVIEEVDRVETDAFADRERVGYRLRVRSDGVANLVEQQAYLSAAEDGRIGWLRVVCSGFRPV